MHLAQEKEGKPQLRIPAERLLQVDVRGGQMEKQEGKTTCKKGTDQSFNCHQ